MGHLAIPLRWVDVRNPDASYVRSDFEVAASGILETYGYVSRNEIDLILNVQPAPAAEVPGTWGYTSGGISTDHLAPVYLSRYYSVQDIPQVIDSKGDWKYTKADFMAERLRQDSMAERLRQDSLQEVYRERLATLIYRGLGNNIIHPGNPN